jgi:hypothetical protein
MSYTEVKDATSQKDIVNNQDIVNCTKHILKAGVNAGALYHTHKSNLCTFLAPDARTKQKTYLIEKTLH